VANNAQWHLLFVQDVGLKLISSWHNSAAVLVQVSNEYTDKYTVPNSDPAAGSVSRIAAPRKVYRWWKRVKTPFGKRVQKT
jgi:hypothetical protein